MIFLDFQIDQVVISDDRKTDIVAADAAALQETYFIMPVRLSVGNVDLFEIPVHQDERVQTRSQGEYNFAPIPWLPLPILSVATVGLEAVEYVGWHGASIYNLPGGWRLHFSRVDANILISSEVNQCSAQISHTELLDAFKGFSAKVKQVLSQEVLELRQHPVWGRWIQGID